MANGITLAGTTTKTLSITEPYSLKQEVLAELLRILTTEITSDTRVLLLTGTHPEAFLADVSKLQSLAPRAALAFSELGQKVCAALETLPCPVIALINGAALGGGCEMTLSCDFVYATESSCFGQIEVHGGILPGFGGTWRLRQRVGDLKTRELLFTGTILDAKAAQEVGLVSEVVAPDQLQAKAQATAETMTANPPLAVRSLKQMILANRSLSLSDSNALERQAFAFLFGTTDQKEAMKAYLEKRTVSFEGR
ncbi:MAG: enoyl-CoA hydratase/isomerase family protein [Acidobacteriaceae bacterium]|nr:enoyl-CoA hydratase/isomerase family protein [Acidobacteriaceae bacterium]